MSNKLLIKNSSSYLHTESNIDIENGLLSSSNIQFDDFKYGNDTRIYKITNKLISPIEFNQQIASGSAIQSNSGDYSPVSVQSVSFSGDIGGDLNKVYIRNISNVQTGTLNLANGGTGTGSFAQNSIITVNNSLLLPTNDKIIAITDNNGTISLVDKSFIVINKTLQEPIVYLYTGSVGSDNTFVWQKPLGSRLIKVICQGGGAAGANAGSFNRGSFGGGGGGYSKIMFNALHISDTVAIQAGRGGKITTNSFPLSLMGIGQRLS